MSRKEDSITEEKKEESQESVATEDSTLFTPSESDSNPEEQNFTELEKNSVETLEKELVKYKDIALRARADYDNLKRRVERQKEDTKNFLIRDIANGILDAMDNFERALITVGTPVSKEEKGEKFDGLLQGIEMVLSQINTVLGGYGVMQTGNIGEHFDPKFHEAIQMEDKPDVNGQVIGNVFQKGYKIDEFCLRLAKVQVWKGQAQETPQE